MDSPISMQFELPSPESDLFFTRVTTRLSPEARQKIKDTLATSFSKLTTPYTLDVDHASTSMAEEAPAKEQEIKLEPLVAQMATEWKICSTRVKLNTYAHLLGTINIKTLSDSIRTDADDGILDMDGDSSLGKRSAFAEDFYDADLFRPSKMTPTADIKSGTGLQNIIFDYPDNYSAQSFCEIKDPAELTKYCSRSGMATPTCDNGSSLDTESCDTGLGASKKRLVQMKLKAMVSNHFSHKPEEGLSTLISSLYRASDF